MAVGVAKVNAVGIISTAADGDAGRFEGRFDVGEVASSQAQRQVIDFAAGMDFFVILDLEQRDTLRTAL